MAQQSISLQVTDTFVCFVAFAILIAISAFLTWGQSPAFTTTATVVDKHWYRSIAITVADCDDGFGPFFGSETPSGCGDAIGRTEYLEGDRFTPLSWPVIHEEEVTPPLSWLVAISPQKTAIQIRREAYYIDFFDPDRRKKYTYKTKRVRDYKALTVGIKGTIIVDRFGEVKQILPESFETLKMDSEQTKLADGSIYD
ncbi:MAG: hypothetical protein J7647_30555 [Cyanobacteria bacterium SBLK]|nr:hypothetical protein [Cyanobacteria bacterium SBLK]